MKMLAYTTASYLPRIHWILSLSSLVSTRLAFPCRSVYIEDDSLSIDQISDAPSRDCSLQFHNQTGTSTNRQTPCWVFEPREETHWRQTLWHFQPLLSSPSQARRYNRQKSACLVCKETVWVWRASLGAVEKGDRTDMLLWTPAWLSLGLPGWTTQETPGMLEIAVF